MSGYKDGRFYKPYFCKICNKSITVWSGLYGEGTCSICSKTGRKHTDTVKKKISKATKGKLNPNYKDGVTLKTKCKCGNTKDFRANSCGKCGHKGRNNSMFGKLPSPKSSYGKRIRYKNICFRSSYEFLFAKWCDKNRIKWDYESKTFDLGKKTYTPDFYIPIYAAYIEIKGYWRKDAKIKFNLFKKLYPDEEIVVLQKYSLIKLGVL